MGLLPFMTVANSRTAYERSVMNTIERSLGLAGSAYWFSRIRLYISEMSLVVTAAAAWSQT